MFYAIYGEDVPSSLEQRLSVRPAHLARLTQLQNAGRLLLAGPFPAIDSIDPGPAGFSGSLIVAEFDSLTAAQAWLVCTLRPNLAAMASFGSARWLLLESDCKACHVLYDQA